LHVEVYKKNNLIACICDTGLNDIFTYNSRNVTYAGVFTNAEIC